MTFLVLAHHRSGSNFLCDVLQAHPEVECLSEPFSMHTSAYLSSDLLRWEADEYRPDVLHDELAALPEAVAFTKDLAAYTATGLRGFKETLGFEKLGWLRRVFPGLRVILLVRDPRAVTNAVISRDMEGIWDYRNMLARYRERYGSGLPFPVLTDTAVDRIVSSWQVRLFEARRSLAGVPFTLVRFEDLMADAEAALAEVMRTVGCEVHPDQLRFIEASHSGPSRGGNYSTVRDPQQVLSAWRKKLRAEEIDTVNRRLRREMEELGYE